MSTDHDNQLSHVANRNQKSLSDHGQKLFNAINCMLNDDEQLELTQALFKYQKDHNVFTLVRCCREIFDTARKNSLMLFMRPVIPVRDRFHYDEYYKLFFPEEFTTSAAESKSIFAELIPKDLVEKTIEKARKKREAVEEAIRKEQEKNIEMLEKINLDLNLDLEKLKQAAGEATTESNQNATENVVKIAGFRIIELRVGEGESLGFSVCLGPTGTFVMVAYVEPDSLAFKLGMRVGDELVSVNEISLKMTSVEYAIDILSSADVLNIVLQTSGFMPDEHDVNGSMMLNAGASERRWLDPFAFPVRAPAESNQRGLKSHIRYLEAKMRRCEHRVGFSLRGGLEHEVGVFVVAVQRDSMASRAGLRDGDQLLFVNANSLVSCTLESAVKLMRCAILLAKSNKAPIRFTVRYLGKVPSVEPCPDVCLDFFDGVPVEDVVRSSGNVGFILEKNFHLFVDEKELKMVRRLLSEYLNMNLSIDFVVGVFKEKFIKRFELIDCLRQFVRSWEIEVFDRVLIEMNVAAKGRRGKAKSGDSACLISMRSCEDLSRLDFGMAMGDGASRSLDNLQYFISGCDSIKPEPVIGNYDIEEIMKGYGKPYLISIEKKENYKRIGFEVDGGVNTKQMIPCVTRIQGDSFAFGYLKVGQLLLNVNKVSLIGISDRKILHAIEKSFRAWKMSQFIEFIVADPVE